MKYKFTIKTKNNHRFEIIANNNKEAYDMMMDLNTNGNTKCYWYEPLNKPEKRIRIDFK